MALRLRTRLPLPIAHLPPFAHHHCESKKPAAKDLCPWGDPSTLEFLSLVVEQVPAARLCALFTRRPALQPLCVHRLKAAQVLSLPLPPVLLLRADEVIE